jgi:hypothetical protein
MRSKPQSSLIDGEISSPGLNAMVDSGGPGLYFPYQLISRSGN